MIIHRKKIADKVAKPKPVPDVNSRKQIKTSIIKWNTAKYLNY